VPLYEYQCKQCGHRFEKIQSFSAPDEKECPKCGAEVERLISAPAIQFKGAGWYVNDYASKGADSSSESGGESKPAESKEATKTNDTSKSNDKPAASSPAPSAPSTPAPTPKASSES
jgi:putative FmdB family regulatory protein